MNATRPSASVAPTSLPGWECEEALMSRYLVFAVTAAVSVLLDFATKQWVHTSMPYRSVDEITSFFNLVYVRNYGAAFGMLSGVDESLRQPFFLGISLVAFGAVGWMLHKAEKASAAYVLSLALIFSGAVGNFIDRIRFGFVVDFLDFHLGGAHWPSFNVADIAITVGVGLMLLDGLLEQRRNPAAGSSGEPA